MQRTILIIGFALAFLAIFAACDEGASKFTLPGSACGGQEPFACDGDRLKVCGVDGRWAYESCTNICASLGTTYAGVCRFDEKRGHDFCACGDECCEQGSQQCKDGKLGLCRDCEWTLLDCTQYCSQYERESLGCGRDPISDTDICLCEGMTTGLCPGSFEKCAEGHVNLCDSAGSWNAADCHALCEGQGYHFSYCSLDADKPEEACHCSTEAESEVCKNHVITCLGDFISICEGFEEKRVNCASECSALGLAYTGCGPDKDRGHDACFCAEE